MRSPSRSPLGDLAWPEVGRPIILVPCGACEQHGPHLPLSTDTIIATELATAVAGEHRIAAPPVAVGASGEHGGFAGTLSIGTAATTRLLVELIRSADWAAGVMIVNAHGGNAAAVAAAIKQSHADGRTRVAAWSPTSPAQHDTDLHAGHVETSVMLHVRPDLVDMNRAAAGPTPSIAELRDRGVAALSDNGVLGDPTTATADQGRAIFQAWRIELTAELNRLDELDHRPEATR